MPWLYLRVPPQQLKGLEWPYPSCDELFLPLAEVARVSIAKAYTHSRRHRCIYLFDDLFTSLDQKSADELAQLLQTVARQGKVVVAQAYRQDITSSFDQVLEMRDGELVQVRKHP